ncbi:MAG: TerB family tellurite resistance protein [Calditrichaeota bacterium]|nr:TerB family tellurite resistance protein [Calditrichota bacterium]
MFKFFEKILTPDARADDISDYDLMVATVGLFLEIVYADFDLHPEEEKQLYSSLENMFGLKESVVKELIANAREERSHRQDIWQFASLLKDHFSREKRLSILANLWRLVFADGKVDKYEDALIRKITTLLGLDHSDMIQTKLQVKKEFE